MSIDETHRALCDCLLQLSWHVLGIFIRRYCSLASNASKMYWVCHKCHGVFRSVFGIQESITTAHTRQYFRKLEVFKLRCWFARVNSTIQ